MRRGGGLYSNFVPVNDSENRPYRGAEIPPPSNLTGRQGGSGMSRNYGGVPPPANFHGSSSNSGSGVNKQGYSTINSISAGMMNYSSGEKEVNIRKARTEDDYFNEDDDTDYQIGKKKPKIDQDEDLPYQPAPGSPSANDASKQKQESSDSEEDPLDAFMANLEKDAQSKGVKAIGRFYTDFFSS